MTDSLLKIVFTGPTISHVDAQNILLAEYRPPAKRGDIYRAALSKPVLIAIIDGYFESAPSVWHKEILWALKQGIQVWGCSSMGALRAVELESFGMCGVGEIFAAFKSGELNDDDEVALMHGPAETGYIACSEPLVNIRATIKAAQSRLLISKMAANELLMIAKKLHYRQRSYQTIIAYARQRTLVQLEIDAFERFAADYAVNQKREDALTMLKCIADQNYKRQIPEPVTFHFEHTDNWQQLINQIDLSLTIKCNDTELDDLIEELKLCQRYNRLFDEALNRRLGLDAAHRHGVLIDEEKLTEMLAKFCRQRGLLNDNAVNFDALSRWYTRQRLSIGEFDALIKNEASLQWLKDIYAQSLHVEMIECLKLSGEFAAYQSRSQEKKMYTKSKAEKEIKHADLWAWYFTTCLDQPIPSDLDEFARNSGFDNVTALQEAVSKEYLYMKRKLEKKRQQPVS